MENIYLGWPQCIFLFFIACNMAISVAKANGWRPKPTVHSNTFHAVRFFTVPITWVLFFYWGGFFTA